jgi:acyl dehydratase
VRYFEDFRKGDEYRLATTTVDRDEMIAFARRFDPQPFHVDEDAARASLFGGLCASGWFTASLWMRCYVDGLLSRSASLGSPGGDEIAWPAPVFPGDRLDAGMDVVAARASASRPTLGLVTLTGTFSRAGTEVFRGRFTGMFARRGDDGATDPA